VASWYDGVGHVPHLEEPGRFNRELAALTRRAQGRLGGEPRHEGKSYCDADQEQAWPGL